MSKRPVFRTVEAPEDETLPVVEYSNTRVTPQFVFAGRAFFRVTDPKGKNYLYKVHMRDGKGEWVGDKAFFVRVATNSGYKYLGVLLDDGTIKPTGRSQHLPGTPEFEVSQWAFRCIIDGYPVPKGYTIDYTGRCGVCGMQMSPDEIKQDPGIHVRCRK